MTLTPCILEIVFMSFPKKSENRVHDALMEVISDRPGAADRLASLLYPELLEVARGMLKSGEPGPEDVVQDSLVAILAYIRRRPDFEGRIEAFAATVVRNRCRDLLRQRAKVIRLPVEDYEGTLESDFLSPMDDLIAREVTEGLNDALARLDSPCRDLLISIFIEKRSLPDLRAPLGLSSVQAIYYRKKICLEKLRRLFKSDP